MMKLETHDLVTAPTSTEIQSRYESILLGKESGFSALLENSAALIEESKKVFLHFSHKKTFVQIGIGGSSLGPEMLVKALKKNNERTFIFINNIDSDELYDQLSELDLKTTLFYVVSKSGSTAETMAALSYVFKLLSSAHVPQDQWRDFIVFSTDPVKSELLTLADELKISCLKVPSEVGGRYSVLTSVGLLPALFAGINLEELFQGAHKAKNSFVKSNEFYDLASSLHQAYLQGFDQTVMMPYSSKLKDFSSWFVQLWAESLGKEMKGLTPIASYGATDQHSQVQLFMEGPKNKVIVIIGFQKSRQLISLLSEVQSPTLNLLSPFSLHDLMRAELHGTLRALNDQKRPLIFFDYEELNPSTLGHMIFTFECLTALVGCHLQIDPFNQPGVEAGKKYALNWLKKKS